MFSDFIFCILNVILDAALIVFLQKQSKKRIRLVITESIHKTYRKISSKGRLKAMIILNSINFLVLRMPLSILDFYGLLVSARFQAYELQYTPNLISFYVCRLFKFCDSLQKVSYSLYAISFIFQFLIFLKLDSNFTDSFSSLVHK